MNLWLVIPVKPLTEGKTRLASALSPASRAMLMRDLLTGVLLQVNEGGLIDGAIVISRDEAVLTLAESLGAQTLRESGLELNAALDEARRMAVANGAEGLLALPADLPLMTADDILELREFALTGVQVIVAPSHDGGTNALLLSPPNAIEFAFGEDSFEKHLAQARKCGLSYAVYRSETLGHDVDVPEDLTYVANRKPREHEDDCEHGV
jgi:2-phospho-L-lactate/phosphoenolpyruvate guanylyltransferase